MDMHIHVRHFKFNPASGLVDWQASCMTSTGVCHEVVGTLSLSGVSTQAGVLTSISDDCKSAMSSQRGVTMGLGDKCLMSGIAVLGIV